MDGFICFLEYLGQFLERQDYGYFGEHGSLILGHPKSQRETG